MHIQPKKSLGQNFLIDKNIQKKIINACDLSSEDIVLEIGAGLGDLSLPLASVAGKVYALEIDSRLLFQLEENLSRYKNCRIIKGDILKFDLKKFLREEGVKQKIKIIGNVPYYISSPIIEHLIGYRDNISVVFMTVQKEFARRVVACPGTKTYGSFSCFVQYYASGKILFEIKKNCFKPVPKVDSCFLSLKFRDRPAVKVANEEMLFRLIRTAFNQRRKTLRNSLEGIVQPKVLEKFFDQCGINMNTRPEKLSLEQFAVLAEKS